MVVVKSFNLWAGKWMKSFCWESAFIIGQDWGLVKKFRGAWLQGVRPARWLAWQKPSVRPLNRQGPASVQHCGHPRVSEHLNSGEGSFESMSREIACSDWHFKKCQGWHQLSTFPWRENDIERLKEAKWTELDEQLDEVGVGLTQWRKIRQEDIAW